jgi:hypothetical protein
VNQPNQVKKHHGSHGPSPHQPVPPNERGVMTAPQARWLVPHRPRKSKEVGPRGGPRFRTTSIPSRLAGIPLAGPSSMAAWPNRRQQAGPQGRSKKPHGQSPRKKPRGEGTFLLRLDREKAATERGRKESIGLVEDRAEDGCPKEAKFGPHDPPHQLPRALHPSDGRGCWRRRRCGGFVHVGGEKTRTKGFEMKISNNFGSPRHNPPPSSLDRQGKRAGDRGQYS